MKIAVSSTGTDLNAQVDPRFGRCQYFIVVDLDTMESEVLENSGAMSGGGAGIATGQIIAGKGVGAVLTGNCGPNAFNILEASGIKVMTGVSGMVQDAVEGYKSGKYQASSQANVDSHSGMGRGGGIGRR
ncbi:NifB/NifX family molybdenum-iron cluster-binding protein [Chloroflexota bacterium]